MQQKNKEVFYYFTFLLGPAIAIGDFYLMRCGPRIPIVSGDVRLANERRCFVIEIPGVQMKIPIGKGCQGGREGKSGVY